MTYRVGNHQPQNVYRDDQYIGVMFTAEDAALVVETLNGRERRAFRPEPALICPSCPDAAFLHRDRDEPNELSCIGKGPGYACTCRRTRQGIYEQAETIRRAEQSALCLTWIGEAARMCELQHGHGGECAPADSCTGCTAAKGNPDCPVHQGRKPRGPKPPPLGPGCICDGSGRTCPRHGAVI